MFLALFQPINLIVCWVPERVKKMPYKGGKMSKKTCFLNVTHFSKYNFQGLFKNVVFRSVVLVTKIHLTVKS